MYPRSRVQKHRSGGTKALGCTAGSCVLRAACCVLRAACCVMLAAGCEAPWPPTPKSRHVPTAVRSRYLSHISLTTFPPLLPIPHERSLHKEPQIPWPKKKCMLASLDASHDQYSSPPATCSQPSPSSRKSSPLVPPPSGKAAAAAIMALSQVSSQEDDRARIAREAAKRAPQHRMVRHCL